MMAPVFVKKTMEELNRPGTAAIKNAERFPVWIFLDDVRSMHNVGSVFRTADAFHAAGICLCGYTPTPPHRDIHKTALGATETVPWRYAEDIAAALAELKKEGFSVWAAEQVHHSISLEDTAFAPDQKIALVFGNEVTGVSEKALALCDGCIEIPQWGAKHSLNISVTVGVVLWEMVRSRRTSS